MRLASSDRGQQITKYNAATTANTSMGWKVALLMIWPARVISVKPMMAASEVPLMICTR